MRKLVFFASIVTCFIARDLEAQTVAEDQRMAFMQQQAEAFTGSLDDQHKIAAYEKPLLRWTNPHTNIRDGVLVCWIDEHGVPAAAAQICLTPNSTSEWAIELQSLSTKPIELSNGKIETWSPVGAGIQWHAIKQGFASPTPSKRLVQMRGIARKFRGHDDFEKEENVVRLLTNPLIRYSNPKSGIVDGAMFAMVHGTDPEILILIEARKSDDGNTTFFWALAPMTSFELRVFMDQKQIWTKPKMTSNLPTDVFFQRLLVAGEKDEPTLTDRVKGIFGF